ncbi:LacI family DNA-binding transcriptional regulator [Bifidobacterium sp. ESL0775]|uniref:LacI family DNA-binding transcriptional regulator n=1 Tax=Bifidobacterium sp. ESL0775 TaxID=2983230 RepID=UPI0023F99FAB|nr:LacI family DNA-binding transcriptional regulator [Bifidobacterium sp. ESL0775]WEV69052.1 LacI family DNA-binding transcriptional regulator [Bifidobacterium sp. ESL0775]
MKKHYGVTLTDIADELNLSIYTVSRAINGLSGVSKKTRAIVLESAERHGYIPNANARDLRKGVHHSVTLLTAETSNPYYLDLISGIESVFQDKDESLLIADMAVNGKYSEANETMLLQQVLENRPGGIISTLGLSDASRQQLLDWKVPVVFVDSVPGDGKSDFSYVATDNAAASAMLGEHLSFHHYKRWLLAIYPGVWNSRFVRESGLREAAKACGAEINVLECPNDQRDACRVYEDFLANSSYHPDVTIAANNPILLGVLKALNHRNLRVPEDMPLVAFDDFAWSDLLSPKITLVAEDSHGIGARSAELLLDLIESRKEAEDKTGEPAHKHSIHESFEATLKIRESCGCVHQQADGAK